MCTKSNSNYRIKFLSKSVFATKCKSLGNEFHSRIKCGRMNDNNNLVLQIAKLINLFK